MRFDWKSYTVVVREVDRATALDIARRVIEFISDIEADKLAFAAFLTNLLASHSRITMLKDGQPLPDGVHVIDDDPVTLPITEANFGTLPASLAGEIVNASESVNGWLMQSFLASALIGLNTTTNSALSSALTP